MERLENSLEREIPTMRARNPQPYMSRTGNRRNLREAKECETGAVCTHKFNHAEASMARTKESGNISRSRLGVLDAAECPPTFCSDPEMVQGVLAGGASALLRSSEGLEDLEAAGHEDLDQRGFNSGDCLVGIAAGGTTPYVRGGLRHARDIGALAIAMACVPSDQATLPCDIDIRLLTGPELLTGSTRLKAGTATKMALNIISTAVMVRLGKVYGNRMVDVSASNSKLVDRSLRILRDLAAVERDRGLALLDEADGSVKLALLIAVGELEPGAARELLQKHSGQLREALASLGLNLAQS